ncbi:hypothetical protein ACFXKI_49865 [Streptomyces mirabilis]|uniref:hypothetical protein n=1 Tax=Streptomyces mirabilis TaxID=68239 RepID=UPI00369B318B
MDELVERLVRAREGGTAGGVPLERLTADQHQEWIGRQALDGGLSTNAAGGGEPAVAGGRAQARADAAEFLRNLHRDVEPLFAVPRGAEAYFSPAHEGATHAEANAGPASGAGTQLLRRRGPVSGEAPPESQFVLGGGSGPLVEVGSAMPLLSGLVGSTASDPRPFLFADSLTTGATATVGGVASGRGQSRGSTSAVVGAGRVRGGHAVRLKRSGRAERQPQGFQRPRTGGIRPVRPTPVPFVPPADLSSDVLVTGLLHRDGQALGIDSHNAMVRYLLHLTATDSDASRDDLRRLVSSAVRVRRAGRTSTAQELRAFHAERALLDSDSSSADYHGNPGRDWGKRRHPSAPVDQ